MTSTVSVVRRTSSSPLRRKSSLAAEKRVQSQLHFERIEEPQGSLKRRSFAQNSKGKSKEEDEDEKEFAEGEETDNEDEGVQAFPSASKKQKSSVSSAGSGKRAKGGVSTLANGENSQRLFGLHQNHSTRDEACVPPMRQHSISYHRPLLLDVYQGKAYRAKLLDWFDSVSSSRAMPWRKEWLDPHLKAKDKASFRQSLEKRAYEVWISEIMLQQTRVAVVIDYWNKWMARWPTIQDLAQADPDDVLSAWRGLGYYSRATRIHQAAKKVVDDEGMQGLLPATADELEKHVPGVGRYTGGAISAIVFGHPAPMVDGNVLRVLSRQLGILGNVKTNKQVIDTLWAAADALVKAVAQFDGDDEERKVGQGAKTSDRPGRWGQALMELGSTICAPRPNCTSCPISGSCRAYAEGRMYAQTQGFLSEKEAKVEPMITDLEDVCSLCEPFEESVEGAKEGEDEKEQEKRNAPVKSAKSKPNQATLSSFAFTQKKGGGTVCETQANVDVPNAKAMEVIIDHAKRFPVKVVKKAVREEETLVCAIRRKDGRFLLHRRPEKGLLAGLWELPSFTLPESNDSTPAQRKAKAAKYVEALVAKKSNVPPSKPKKEIGSVPWLFSHLRLTMHVYSFSLDDEWSDKPSKDSRWATAAEVEAESMGTGMRKCWTLAHESEMI